MREAELRITLEVDYGEYRSAAVKIATPYIEAFAPVDVCSDPFTAYVVGGHTSESVKVVKKMREGYAKILAEAIAEQLLEFMEAKDLRNGYPMIRTPSTRSESK